MTKWYSQDFWQAWQYGHNALHMPTWQLARYAHAYADLCLEEVLRLDEFTELWNAGEFEPDSIGRYHHTSWFDRKVAWQP